MVDITQISIKGKWICEFCNKPFTKESAFLKHKCKQMERYDEMRTPIGQLAFSCYKRWLKLLGRPEGTADQFINSSFFTQMIKFAMLSVELKFNVDDYIGYCCKKNYTPAMWCYQDVISAFLLRTGDKNIKNEVISSINFLLDVCDENDISITELIEDVMTPKELYSFCKIGQISPWLFFNSGKLKNKIKDCNQPTIIIKFQQLYDPCVWINNMKLEVNDDLKKIIKQTGL